MFNYSDEPKYEVEETLVIPKLLQNQTNFLGARKSIGIAVALSAILIVIAVWAGFQFGKKENVWETISVDSANTNTNSTVQPLNPATGTGEQNAANINLNTNMTVPNKMLSGESNSLRNQTHISPTPYVLQPGNSYDREVQLDYPIMNTDDYDIPIDNQPVATPTPRRKTPTPEKTISEDCRYNGRCN